MRAGTRGAEVVSDTVAQCEVATERHAVPEGVNHAMTSSGLGRVEIGKNVPEKRNIGRMRKRKIAMNDTIDPRVPPTLRAAP